jgi:K+-transporting ATPase A subunit
MHDSFAARRAGLLLTSSSARSSSAVGAGLYGILVMAILSVFH